MGTFKGFTGQYEDTVSGLDYYNARYYDPVVGRFISADSVQGNFSGSDPYAYVGGNPESYTDPTGQLVCDEVCGPKDFKGGGGAMGGSGGDSGNPGLGGIIAGGAWLIGKFGNKVVQFGSWLWSSVFGRNSATALTSGGNLSGGVPRGVNALFLGESVVSPDGLLASTGGGTVSAGIGSGTGVTQTGGAGQQPPGNPPTSVTPPPPPGGQYNGATYNSPYTQHGLEHIFEGRINSIGEATGYHWEGLPNTSGQVTGNITTPDARGVYEAQISVKGMPKFSNNGFSSLFPQSMSLQEIFDNIDEAYAGRVRVGGWYLGETSSGMVIQMGIDQTGAINTAFPWYEPFVP